MSCWLQLPTEGLAETLPIISQQDPGFLIFILQLLGQASGARGQRGRGGDSL